MPKKSTIISENQDTPNSPSYRQYVDNEAFYESLKKRRECIENGDPVPQRIEDHIGECIMLIAENVANRWNFARYSWRDEMVGDAVVQCTRAIDKFDVHQYKNPFAYFTQCTVYAFLSRLQKEEQETYTKYKATIESATMGQLDDSDDEDSAHILDNVDVSMDYMIEYIQKHEAKMEKKKKGSKKGKNSASIDELYNEDKGGETHDDSS